MKTTVDKEKVWREKIKKAGLVSVATIKPSGAVWQHRPCSYTVNTECMGCPAPSLGTLRYNGSISTIILDSTNANSAELRSRQSEVWDPGNHLPSSSSSSTWPWVSGSDRNKTAHITHRNTGQCGKEVTCHTDSGRKQRLIKFEKSGQSSSAQ